MEFYCYLSLCFETVSSFKKNSLIVWRQHRHQCILQWQHRPQTPTWPQVASQAMKVILCTIDRGHADVHGPCCHQRRHWSLWSVLWLGAVLMSKVYAATRDIDEVMLPLATMLRFSFHGVARGCVDGHSSCCHQRSCWCPQSMLWPMCWCLWSLWPPET